MSKRLRSRAGSQAHRSLLKRSFGAFALLVLLVWVALMVREVIDVRIIHARNGQAWNHVWAEHVRLQVAQWHGQPQKLTEALAELERLRGQEWQEMGYAPPIIALQVWRGKALLFHQAPQGLSPGRSGPDESRPAGDANWLYVEVALPEQDIVIRRWQERPGNWHFSLQGLAYYARPLFYTLPLMLLPAWLLMRQGFAPLRRIGRRIERRSAGDLSPLPPSPYVELAPIVDSVNSLMQRLQQRLSREREFLLDAAHELKTPLAIIQLNAEALSRANPEASASADLLKEGVTRATHSVHQLLALARSGADVLSTEQRVHDLVSLCQDRIAQCSPLALVRQMDISLEAPEQCPMLMHLESMSMMLDNLLDNAIKYAPPSSAILLRLRVGDEGLPPTQVLLEVMDQGPGIPENQRRQVFERFFRLPDMPTSGSGLGLSIVERCVLRHGGSIKLTEGLGGRGLRVQVTLPIGCGTSSPSISGIPA